MSLKGKFYAEYVGGLKIGVEYICEEIPFVHPNLLIVPWNCNYIDQGFQLMEEYFRDGGHNTQSTHAWGKAALIQQHKIKEALFVKE